MAVTLREVTADTVRQVCELELAPGQQDMVAPNAVSISEAYFEPKAWFRAIYSDDELVGFVMLLDDTEKPLYYLWRMMIAAPHQRKGYGRHAMDLLVDYVKTRPNATELKVSYVPVDGGPQHFYEKHGFQPTGEVHGGEVVMALDL